MSELQSKLLEQDIILLNTTDCHQLISLIYLSLFFNNTTGIDFTHHPQLYHNYASDINGILPIIKLLILSFRLKCIYLFFHRDITNPCPLE